MLIDLVSILWQEVSFLGITSDIVNSHRQFNTKMEFYGSGEDSIIAEYFLFFVRVFGVSPDPDSGISISWQFRTSDSNRAISWVKMVNNKRTDSVKAQVLFLELFFYPKEDSSISLFKSRFTEGKAEGKELNLRFFNIFREGRVRAFNKDFSHGAEVMRGHLIQAIEDSIPHLRDNIFNFNICALITEIGTALIPGPGRIESTILRDNLKGNDFQLMEDIDQDVEDFIIEFFADSSSELRESSLRGDTFYNTSISSVGSAFIFIPKGGKEVVHVVVFINKSEQIQQKDGGRVIRWRPERRVAFSE